MANLGNRIIVLIDMDCFYCQVETRLQPEFAGKPLAVVQYNQWKLGGIIAVNYEAREFGVTRHMRGEEAKAKCPELLLASVPCLRGKSDTSKYRSAGREVIEVLKKNCSIVERASVDEAYLDITQIIDDELAKKNVVYDDMIMQLKNTFVVGHSESGVNSDEQRIKGLETWLSELSTNIQIQRLSTAGVFIENLRKEIFDITGFKCSAGISFNKILAKLACGLHKPNRQTILPSAAVSELFSTLPVKKVRNLGGKLGDIVIDSLQCNVMSDLLRYSLPYLQNRFDEKTGSRLYNIARGVDNEPVTPRLVSKSIGACKNFPGKQAIVDTEILKRWLFELSSEICERLEQDLEENERKASLLTVSFHYYQNKSSVSQSRSCTLTSYKPEKITEQCFNIVTKATQQHPVSFLGVSAGKFVRAKGSENFVNFFKTSAIDKLTSTSNKNVSKDVDDPKLDQKIEESNNASIDNSEKGQEIDNNLIKMTDNRYSKSSIIKSEFSLTASPCRSIQHSLKSDNFKKSFFMNILKEQKAKTDNLIKNETTNENSNTCDTNTALNENSNSSENILKNNHDTVFANSHNINAQEKNCLPYNKEVSVGLKEIFPDLNDIDPNIVRLLPPHLQEEVKKLLKTTEIHDKNIDKNKIMSKDINKSSKGKFLKSKSINQKSNIQTFFIKTNVNNDADNLRKCLQCDQLILTEKFDEHTDYHVAQNLHKEMNQISDNDETRKRKAIVHKSNHLKKRLNEQNITDELKKKSIMSFFQQ